MTITLDVPKDLERQLREVPEEDVVQFALAAIRREFQSVADTDAFLPLNDEDNDAIERGFADKKAGRVYDVEMAFAKLRQERDAKR